MTKEVTFIVPVLNEEEALPYFFSEIERVLAATNKRFHNMFRFTIVFINDGSNDGTEEVITNKASELFNIKLINLSRNFGKEQALYAGICESETDALIPIDVDLQDPPELIPEMLEKWQSGYDSVVAKRVNREEDSWCKQLSSRWFYKLFNVVAERPIPSNVGDYRLMDRKVVDAVKQVDDQKRFNKEVFSWVGYSTTTIDFHRKKRVEGTTKWSAWGLWNFALDGIFSSSTLPLRLWSYMGFMFSILSFLYLLFLIAHAFVFGRDVPGYSSIVCIVLFFGGMNFLSLGIMGEYIGRIYSETRDRPTYIISSKFGFNENI